MSKLVRYNGETQSYYGCSDPRLLTKGEVYEVMKENVSGFHTEYVLNGFAGEEFNSLWFDEVVPVYTAVSHNLPVIGQRFECLKVDMSNGTPNFVGWLTSKVQGISPIGSNVYQVRTENSMYIVTVG